MSSSLREMNFKWLSKSLFIDPVDKPETICSVKKSVFSGGGYYFIDKVAHMSVLSVKLFFWPCKYSEKNI